jgi:hypothetical protein
MAKQTPRVNQTDIDAENLARATMGHRGDESDPLKAAIEKAIPLRVTGKVNPATGLLEKTVTKNER